MSFRFRRSVKVFPGVRLNFSQSGISTSIGGRGASVTFSGKGTYVNLGIPGTGLSYREKISGPRHQADSGRFVTPPPEPSPLPFPPPYESPIPIEIPGEIKSAASEVLTSASLVDFRDLLVEAHEELRRLKAERPQIFDQHHAAQTRAKKWENGMVCRYLFKKKFQQILQEHQEAKTELEELDAEIKKCSIALDLQIDKRIEGTYDALVAEYRRLTTCHTIWDTTSSVQVDQARERSYAAHAITRRAVKLDLSPCPIVASSKPVMHFENANGGDIYLLPGLLLMLGNKSRFALVSLNDVKLECTLTRFVENERIPADTEQIGTTWAKVNKDGGPDRRFANNPEIPIVQYATLTFTTAEGLNEAYLISNPEKAEAFRKALAVHASSLPKTQGRAA